MALLAAWSGYAAAKWSTESRVEIATASSLRIEGSRADADAFELRSYDSSTFESWFSAFIAGNKAAMRLAEHRFRPDFKVAFDAWRATKPETNREAPRGPTYMPQYKRPGAAEARILDERAKAAFLEGETDGSTADKYVRLTVVLASILFLVGISTHFPLPGRPLRPDRSEFCPARAVARAAVRAAVASVLSFREKTPADCDW